MLVRRDKARRLEIKESWLSRLSQYMSYYVMIFPIPVYFI